LGEPSKKSSSPTPIVAVLRWGHRQERDKRLTAHVALTARALGASHFILADVRDEKVEATVTKVAKNWGGSFGFEMGKPWKHVVKDWKAKGGVVVHLTAYGKNIQSSDILESIWATRKDVLVIVGSQKVPPDFFSEAVSDFNVAVGNQPHSECASLAVFLDRFFRGYELEMVFKGAKMRIIPQGHGKKTVKLQNTV
jgi:tRNA (cytidine56-2'-O)-methyltransferase